MSESSFQKWERSQNPKPTPPKVGGEKGKTRRSLPKLIIKSLLKSLINFDLGDLLFFVIGAGMLWIILSANGWI